MHVIGSRSRSFEESDRIDGTAIEWHFRVDPNPLVMSENITFEVKIKIKSNISEDSISKLEIWGTSLH